MAVGYKSSEGNPSYDPGIGPLEHQAWNRLGIAICGLIGVLLFSLWNTDYAFRAFAPIDEACFRTLNNELGLSVQWARIWALLNTRKFDLISGITMGALVLIPGLFYKKKDWILAAFEFTGIFATFSIFRALVVMLAPLRSSPSYYFRPNFYDLSQMFPDIAGKVYADQSFPSDHSAVVFIWALYIVSSSRLKGRFFVIPYALFISMPRLVSGAHWLSDVLLDSIPLVTISFALGYYTPLRAYMFGRGQAAISYLAKIHSSFRASNPPPI